MGTFDREQAVENESIDFFASGHPLVEGLLTHFEDDPKGRVARLDVRIPGRAGRGLVLIYKDGPQFEVTALDTDGRLRPDWAAAFRRHPLRATKMTSADAMGYDWRSLIARLATNSGDRTPHAVAAIVVHG